MERIQKLLGRYRVKDGKRFRLKDIDPADTAGFNSEARDEAKEILKRGIERLKEAQEMLYAQDRWAVLLIFQAMDAAGKDSTIKHVLSGVNPQGCQVYSFKAPSREEIDHDYLWRIFRCLPERGRIGIFNRSYYEEVLVVRVHEEILRAQKLPPSCVSKAIWRERFEDMNAFERYLARNGTVILKFFLHLSKAEQKRRFLRRLDEPAKRWKFSLDDVGERKRWDEYMHVYEDMIRNTSAPQAPWFVVPADNKWFTRLVVAAAVVEALESLDLSFPRVDNAKQKDLARARKALLAERE